MSSNSSAARSVCLWLVVIYVLIVAMVAIGGITRLTDSGLSIVDWRPVTGIVPPLSHEAWLQEFGRYQTSPEFQQVHHWMELADFKRIFFWEYLHRLLGRLLGLVTLVGWVGFVSRGALRGRWVWRTGAILVLGAVQGGLGWFMVKSGLVDVPAVSHFRLAAHLMFAFITAQWVLWLFMDWREPAHRTTPRSEQPVKRAWWVFYLVTLSVLVVQIAFGAFVAGRDAGVLFATFPDLNGTYSPAHFFRHWTDAFTNPAAIHYMHRVLAVVFVVSVFGLFVTSVGSRRAILRLVLLVIGLTVVQVALGALTVIWHVPIATAVAHQCVGLFLLSSLVSVAFEASRARPLVSSSCAR